MSVATFLLACICSNSYPLFLSTFDICLSWSYIFMARICNETSSTWPVSVRNCNVPSFWNTSLNQWLFLNGLNQVFKDSLIKLWRITKFTILNLFLSVVAYVTVVLPAIDFIFKEIYLTRCLILLGMKYFSKFLSQFFIFIQTSSCWIWQAFLEACNFIPSVNNKDNLRVGRINYFIPDILFYCFKPVLPFFDTQ